VGFAGARTAWAFEEAVRRAARAAAPGTAGPSILPMCPAVVNLVELKFPSLVGLLAPVASPWEAADSLYTDTGLACVVSCPGQRSMLAAREAAAAAGEAGAVDCLLPEAFRAPVMQELTAASCPLQGAAPVPASEGCEPGDTEEVLTVTGIRHVMSVLEEIENGLLEDVDALEAYACEGGCFGSPLLFEDHHVARRRWSQGRPQVQVTVDTTGALAGAGADSPAMLAATARRRPYSARPGIRLDPDMGKAIQKLGLLQATLRSLPGRDCGACGAPTCAALAEDVVMERAVVGLCPYFAPEEEDAES
jgi:hypothetical protein